VPGSAVTSSPTGRFNWNVWLERPDGDQPKGEAIATVRPGHRYFAALNLSRRALFGTGVGSRPVGDEVDDIVRADLEDASFEVTVLPDPTGFDFNVVSKPIELQRRRLDDGKDEISGTVGLEVRTKSGAAGRTSLALLVWADSTPVDEIIVSLCISDAASPSPSCPAPSIETSEDTIVATSREEGAPQAALHLVELPGRGMMGVFRGRGQKTPLGWRIGLSAEELADKLNRSVLPALSSAVENESDAPLWMAGRSLFNIVFPPTQKAVRKFVTEFVRATRPSTSDTAPRIHVRATKPRTESPILVPLGIAVLPGPKDAKTEQVIGDFLEVETPLAVRTPLPPRCPERWVVVAPDSADPELNAATSEKVFKPHWEGPKIQRFKQLEEFRKWSDEHAQQPSTAFLVVSHHHDGKLWFKASSPLDLAEINASYNAPSLLILNACGSAQSGGASAFSVMNARGVNAGIATLTEVSGTMAGAFLQCLGDTIDAAPRQLSLGAAHFQSVRCLRNAKSASGKPYGLRALTYVSLGDTQASLCTPH